ncbi:MAG TPA: endo-1,3-alpha-glucanase family glycosylhydrolase [Anaerolineales bacterium]
MPKPLKATTSVTPIPVLSYYYIGFDTTSWNRAETDYPLLGRYASDNAEVMRQHVEWAKAAGINGFIVSWKSTPSLNRRLDQLVQIADQENFKLAIIYESLDGSLNPEPAAQVGVDLDYFVNRYAVNAAFRIFDKPMVIWFGTWKFSRDDIQGITQERRNQLLVLASENNIDGYVRLANLVDGNAYSVNPEIYPGYPTQLITMGNTIHQNGGIWIAPASPGFNARSAGVTTVVDRKNGQTLQTEMNAAMQSNPDAIGLISWNDFSDNSYIEPSQNYGNHYLKILSSIRYSPSLTISDFDSSLPGGTLDYLSLGRLAALGLLGILALIALIVVIWRSSHQSKEKD